MVRWRGLQIDVAVGVEAGLKYKFLQESYKHGRLGFVHVALSMVPIPIDPLPLAIDKVIDSVKCNAPL